jgi:hypothetical protein
MDPTGDRVKVHGKAPEQRSHPIRLGGSVLGPPRHICAFFNNRDDEYRVLLPFIKDGLECGEKAVHSKGSRSFGSSPTWNGPWKTPGQPSYMYLRSHQVWRGPRCRRHAHSSHDHRRRYPPEKFLFRSAGRVFKGAPRTARTRLSRILGRRS